MNTSNDNNEVLVSEISDKFSPPNHKQSVIERRSIRPTTSLKKSFFKVRSLRLGKVTPRREEKKNIVSESVNGL